MFLISRAVLWRLMVDRFESGTVLGGLGYGGKPYHFADVSKMNFGKDIYIPTKTMYKLEIDE